MSTTGRGRGAGERESPAAPPIPSFASLRAPRRSHPAMDVLAPPPSPAQLPVPAALPIPTEPSVPVEPSTEPSVPVEPSTENTSGPVGRPVAAPRPAEWPDLLRFGVRVATAALRLPGVLVREPVRRLRRLLEE